MTWTLFLQIMILMTWAAILASPWTPRARDRARVNKDWNEVNKNVRKP